MVVLSQFYGAFPKLRGKSERTSSPTIKYNCIAYAAGCEDRWWQPKTAYPRMSHWPDGIPGDRSEETLIKVFESLGFTRCDDPSPEEGFSKVALYSKDGSWQHASKQLPDGRWSSKMGEGVDICHTYDALDGGVYGSIYAVMKRKVT